MVALVTPDNVDALGAAEAFLTASNAVADVSATDAGRADRLAGLLHQAVDHVTNDGPVACPLCKSGTVLDDGWVVSAQAEAERLSEQADAVRQAGSQMASAMAQARRLLPAVPDALFTAELVGLDSSAVISAWTALLDAPQEPTALAAHLKASIPDLDAAATELRAAATTSLDRYQDAWRPLAASVSAWVDAASKARESEGRAEKAGLAEKWLVAATQQIEAERFAPIREAVQTFWEQLRLDSNVSLTDVSMKRSGMVRSLELDVTVDDSGASALGVMSQWELHALALAVATTGDLTAEELLAQARALNAGVVADLGGAGNRAAALLGRSALEEAIWSLFPSLKDVNGRAMLLTFGMVMKGKAGPSASFAWGRLTTACHHHAYEMPATSNEIARLLDTVHDVIEAIRERQHR